MPRVRLYFAAIAFALVVVATASPAPPDDGTKRCIQRGIKALKALQADPEAARKHPIGLAALQALTLLECDVPAADPAIQKAARDLRQASIELTHNYSLALTILFLDRLGDPADSYLIQSLAVRMLGGQHFADGWSYNAPRPGADEMRRLTTWLKQRNGASGKLSPAPQQLTTLPAELRDQLQQIQQATIKGDEQRGVGDNSNTQFAVMALWTARRHGVPIADAMARVAARFRRTQGADGGWPYVPARKQQADAPTPSMSCAGLLSLVMCHGVAVEAARRGDPKAPAPKGLIDPAKDPVIHNALVAVGGAVGKSKKSYYFLWSLERVAVACNLSTIGTRDWYAWGRDLLVSSQRPDGSWQGEEGAEVDTCFALLFLRRANLARDLSAVLKGVSDPGQVTLKVGGVGGNDIKPDLDPKPAAIDPPLPKDIAPDTARLCRELLEASRTQQPKLIERLTTEKGVANTDALALAIPRLRGAVQEQARTALAQRLTRMTAATLRGKLAEADIELRIAAIRACATKDDKDHIPDLIGLLTDRQSRVHRAAHKALTLMTRQDFGPPDDATAAQQGRAAAAWQAWWQKQASK